MGGLNGLFVIIERSIKDKKWYKSIPGFIKWLSTIVLVFFAWILFMSSDIAEAKRNYAGLFVPMAIEPINFSWQYYLTRRIALLLILAVAGSLMGMEKINTRIHTIFSTDIGSVIKRIILLLLFVVDILFVVSSTYSPFIYFQF